MKTTIISAVKKSTSFFTSNKSFYFFAILFGCIAIIQYSLFGAGYTLNGISKSDSDAWKNWSVFSMLAIASMLSLMSNSFLMRFDNRYFKLFVFSTILFVGTSMILSLWFDFIKQFLLFAIYLVRFISWKKQSKITQKEIQTTAMKPMELIMHLTLATGIAIGLAFSMIEINKYIRYPDHAPIADAFAITFLLYGSVLLNLKKDESWLVMAIADISYTTMMIMVGGWSGALMGLIYTFMCFCTYVLWRERRINNESKN